MSEVINAIKSAHGGYQYVISFFLFFLLGICLSKNCRKSFLYPAVILTFVVINPLFFQLWGRLNEAMVYWRSLWMIPILPICAFTPALIFDKIKKIQWKILSILACAILLVTNGYMVYAFGATMFLPAENVEKLPNNVVKVAEKLLQLQEYPSVVSDPEISVYLRQYSGKIKTPYSRSVVYGGTSEENLEIYSYLVNEEIHSLAQTMANRDYMYLVTKRTNDELNKYFEFVEYAGDFGIYQVTIKPTQIRSYNQLHQVTKVTCVNEKGQPVIGENGYSIKELAYDEMGRIIYEFYKDPEGYGIPDQYGRAGYRKEYNRYGSIQKETNLGINGEAITVHYATKRCKYNNHNRIIEESYYDVNDNPMLRTDTHISTRKWYYNSKMQVIREQMFDVDGQLVNSSGGYAQIEYNYEIRNDIPLTVFFDVNGNRLECGSLFFHEYLQKLRLYKNEGKVIVFSVKDEASNALNEIIMNDLYALGINSRLNEKKRQSYYAIIYNEEINEEMSSESVCYEGTINGTDIYVISAGYTVGNMSSIKMNGIECSKNTRGINIVVYDIEKNEIIDSLGIDTYTQEMWITR